MSLDFHEFRTENYTFSIEQIFRRNFPGDYTFGPHKHDFAELNYISRGFCEFSFSGKTIPAVKGDTVLIRPDRSHFFRVSPRSDASLLQLSFSLKHHSGSDPFESHPVFKTESYKSFARFRASPELPACITALGKIYNSGDSFRDNYLKIKMQELILLMWKDCSGFSGNRKNSTAGETAAYLQEHFNQEINLENLASGYGISSRALRKLFHQEYNESMSRFLTRIRMAHAEKLLADTDLSVLDIALESGYQSASYFSRHFSSEIGLNPLKYRILFRESQHGYNYGWTRNASEKYKKSIPEGSFLGMDIPFK